MRELLNTRTQYIVANSMISATIAHIVDDTQKMMTKSQKTSSKIALKEVVESLETPHLANPEIGVKDATTSQALKKVKNAI